MFSRCAVYGLIVFIFLASFAGFNMSWYRSTGDCPSGTYVGDLDFEYPADTDKMCLDDGGSTADGTDSGGVIVVGGAINGSYGALLDADSEYVHYDNVLPSNTLPTAGTIECKITTPATLGTVMIFQVFDATTSADDSMQMYTTGGDGILVGRFEGGGTTAWTDSGANVMSTSTTHTVYYTWNNTTDAHCAQIDATGWVCDTEALADWTGGATADSAAVGEYISATTHSQSYKVDDCVIREGYEGT